MRAPMSRRLSACALVLLAACSSDLFHSTEWQTLCDKDPKANGCPGASDDGATSTTATSTTTGGGGAGGEGGAGGGGQGGAAPCIQEPTCDACRACARTELCVAETDACALVADCGLLLDCIYACSADDTACLQTCLNQYPAGLDVATPLFDCEACGPCLGVCAYPCP